MPDYSRAVRVLRAARGITQNDLAKLVKKHESHVSRWETGKRIPRLDAAQLIAKNLDCPIDLFLLLAGDHETPCSPEDGLRLLTVLRGPRKA